MDGGFTVDAGGHFVPDREALRLFEYFFNAGGEEASDILRGPPPFARSHRAIRKRRHGKLLPCYIAYREAARAAFGSGDGRSRDRASRVGELRALQRTMLGADLQRAFYGEEDQLANLDMQRLAILHNRSMTRGEKQQALEARLPAPMRDARHAASAPSALHQRVEAFKASGGSTDAIGALRLAKSTNPPQRGMPRSTASAAGGTRGSKSREAKKPRAPWGNHVGESYRQALEALRQRRFSGTELVRVRALDAEPR